MSEQNDSAANDPVVVVPRRREDERVPRRPPVSADTDLRHFPKMPIFVQRLLDSKFNSISNDAEWRAGVTLWMKSWFQLPAGSLPNDDAELVKLSGYGENIEGWIRVKAQALHGWFICTDGRLYHKVVAEVVNDAIKFSKKQSDTALKGWEKRRREAPQSFGPLKRSPKSKDMRNKRIAEAKKRGRHTKQEWTALLTFCQHRCVKCGGADPHQDHIIPVYQDDSTDAIDNLQPMCSPCNQAKGPERTDFRPEGWRDYVNAVVSGTRDAAASLLRHAIELNGVDQSRSTGTSTVLGLSNAVSASAPETADSDSPIVMRYPCVVHENGDAITAFYDITESKVALWEAAYPKVSVKQVLRELLLWATDHIDKRKTPGHAPHHIAKCLESRQRKADLEPYRTPAAAPSAPAKPDYTAGTANNRRSFLDVDDC